jgi:hypothetical protein
MDKSEIIHGATPEFKDRYIEGAPYGLLFGTLKSKGINYLFLEITENTKKMIKKFKTFFDQAPDSVTLVKETFDVKNIGYDVKTLSESVVTTVKKVLNTNVMLRSKTLTFSQILARKKQIHFTFGPTENPEDLVNSSFIPFRIEDGRKKEIGILIELLDFCSLKDFTKTGYRVL